MTAEQDDKTQDVDERLRGTSVTRRRFVKGTAAAAAGAAALAAGASLGGHAANASPALKPAGAVASNAQVSPDQLFYNLALTQGDPTSFDWNLNLYCNADTETGAGLLTFDANLNPVPDWAESWEANADNSVYTFHIRKNNKGWSTGDPVTAQDFIWSWTRLLDPKNATPYPFILFDIKNANAFNLGSKVNGKAVTADDLGLKAIDDWTLEVTLQGPRGNFLYKVAYTASVAAPRFAVEKYGANWATGDHMPIPTNAPFYVTQWQHNVKAVLTKNPGYWDAERVQLAQVIDPVVPSAKTVQLYESGTGDQQLDWTQIPAADLPRYQSDPTLKSQLKRYVYPGIWFIIPSNGIPPFDKLEVRRAVSHAVDRQRLVTVTKGQEAVADSMVPVGVFGHLDDPAIAAIQKFDPKLAMDSLKGTPYEGGKNWPKITMYMRANEEQYNSDIMANDVVAQLKENLGMDVSIQAVPQSNFSPQLFQNKWQLVFIRWWMDYPDPDNTYGDMFYSRKASGKRQAWSNSQFDDLVLKGKAEADPTKRLAIYKQAEEIIQTDVGYIPLVYRLDTYAFKPWVSGVPVNKRGYTVPDGNIFVRMLPDIVVKGRTAR